MKKIFTFMILAVAAQAAMAAPPEGNWNYVGMGTYTEDLFTVIKEIPRGLEWQVAVYQHETETGWYRITPYEVETAVTEYFGTTDSTPIYINTTDPQKSYLEDFTLFEYYEFYQLVPETGYKGSARYATLTNSIISWPKNSISISDLKNFDFYDSNTVVNQEMNVVLPGAPEDGVWSTLGNVTFIDGVLSPLLTGKPSTIIVPLEERNDLPGYFRLVSPWSQYGGENDFIIDATDPDFVICPFQNTGATYTGRGETWLASVGATYVHEQGWTKEEFIEKEPGYVITYDADNGRIVFPPNSVVFNFPTYDWLKFYQTENPAEAVIIFPGYSSVELPVSVGEDLPAVYYNLQGVRIESPAQGGVYVERRGDSARVVKF